MFKIIIEKNYEAVSEVAFEVFRPVMDLEKPVLGLATGSSPVGLYKKIIEDHSGKIWAESVEGEGTKVIMLLRNARFTTIEEVEENRLQNSKRKFNIKEKK